MSLWQKPESDRGGSSTTTPTSPATSSSTSSPSTSSHERGDGRLVNIGQSIEIRGELTGNEDLSIDGRVNGKINLKDHHLTIGSNGRIEAEIHAKSVLVNGEVVGNIHADDKVEIAPSGSVQGDLSAPRVALADGSSFKGAIDMGGRGTSSSKSGSATPVSNPVPRSAASGNKG